MKRFYLFILVFSVMVPVSRQTVIPIPTPAQLKYQNAELAAFVAIDLHSFDGEFL